MGINPTTGFSKKKIQNKSTEIKIKFLTRYFKEWITDI